MPDQSSTLVPMLERWCIEHGLKRTPTRRDLLTILIKEQEPLTAPDLFDRVRNLGLVGTLNNVYRNLGLFQSIGIVIAHEFHGQSTRYELAGRNRDHLIDLKSGKVIELRDEKLKQLKIEIAQTYGYAHSDCDIKLYVRRAGVAR